jgi:hypothetical protein
MAWYVYVIKSEVDGRLYKGMTQERSRTTRDSQCGRLSIFTIKYLKNRILVLILTCLDSASVLPKQFNIISSTFDPGQDPVQDSRPTQWNLLLTSDNDYGSLNSEFYAQYFIHKAIALKLGFTFLFSEYKTDTVTRLLCSCLERPISYIAD